MRGSSMTPIAVVGMACRLPGGIDSPHKLWEALLRGDDMVTEIPADRWDADELYDPETGVAGHSVSKWGAFIDDVTGFDPDFFGINEREAIAMDPQHRVLLETCWEAVEQAGRTPASMAGTSTGVFIGMSHDDYAMVTSDAGAFDQAYAFTGNPFSMASGRVAHALGLHGPALTLDTACSSSMVAVHQACRSLVDGESDMALAGGVMLMLDPRLYASASGQGMLSPTGRCHSFDVGADGFVRAEGCGVVVLKRLDDAQRDGDRVLAVIRGTASNQDGRTDNILTPSGDAQVAVFRSALAAAGVEPATVGMVEAHGTGTPVGDTIEFNSVSTVYGTEGRCALTSVKSNFGHAESAAGVLALMKAVLAVHHGSATLENSTGPRRSADSHGIRPKAAPTMPAAISQALASEQASRNTAAAATRAVPAGTRSRLSSRPASATTTTAIHGAGAPSHRAAATQRAVSRGSDRAKTPHPSACRCRAGAGRV